jgi:serine/threonine protein phosphatase PrpC
MDRLQWPISKGRMGHLQGIKEGAFMDFFRRLVRRAERLPPDQASTAPLDPRKIPGGLVDELRKHLTTGAAQSIGKERKKNDDALLVFTGSSESVDRLEDFGLFCVADGLGGYEHGATASAVAVRSLARSLTQGAILDLLASEQHDELNAFEDLVAHAIQQANRDVRAKAEGGATTITAALLAGDQIFLGHVGDSRAYLVKSDGMQQLSRDHSLVRQLVDTGTITEEEAESHPQRNVLWNAMGKSIDIKVDTQTIAKPEGAYLLLCTDGLWGVVSEEEIHALIYDAQDPQLACDALIAAANTAGGPDNVTVVLVYFPD